MLTDFSLQIFVRSLSCYRAATARIVIRLLTTFAAVLLMVAFGARVSLAREEPAASSASASAAPVTVGVELPQSAVELVARAGDADLELKRLEQDTAIPPRLVAIEKQFTDRAEPLRKRAKLWLGLVVNAHNAAQITDIIYLWSRERSRLTPIADELSLLSDQNEKAHRKLDQLRRTWRQAAAAETNSTPTEVHDRVKTVLGAIRTMRHLISNRQARVMRSNSVVVDLVRHVDEVIAAAQNARPTLMTATQAPNGSPLWAPTATGKKGWTAQFKVMYGRNRSLSQDFFRSRNNALILQLLLLGGFYFAIGRLRRLAKKSEPADGPNSRALFPPTPQRTLERRFAAALLLTTLTTPLLHQSAPTAVLVLLGVVSIIALLPLVSQVVRPRLRPLCSAATFLFGLVLMRYLVQGVGGAARWLFCLTMLIALALFGVLLRKLRQQDEPQVPRWMRATATMAIISALLATALAANVAGYLGLSYILGDAVLQGSFLAVLLYVSYRIVMAVLQLALREPPLTNLAVVQNHHDAILSRMRSVIAFTVTGLWLWQTLALLTIQKASFEWLRAMLQVNLSVGSLAVPVGGILMLIVGVFLAMFGSRSVRYLLTEDVLPRTPLAPGAQYAVSVSASYLMLVIIFVGTLAAVGFKLDQFAFIVGALGVGIGFGLQNVVNNFVSGLILLFGRPLEVGHMIEVGGLLGKVTRIGFRSSTVRSLAGAEVIVPNGDLVSSQVINWTLTDALRRIEITVGVAYGSELEPVAKMLRSVVDNHPTVLKKPAPEVLFIAFGDSSLDFRVMGWVHFDDFIRVQSELYMAINSALVAANIEIPFPQRDLHLRSVDVEVVDAALAQSGATSNK